MTVPRALGQDFSLDELRRLLAPKAEKNESYERDMRSHNLSPA